MKSKSSTKPIYASQIEGAANSLNSTVNANAPGLQAISSDIQGRLPGLADRAFGNSPTIQAAQGHARSLIAGDYLNNNPYIEQMVGMARNNAADDVNSRFGATGGIGGTAWGRSFGRGLSEAELGVRSGLYSQERQAQDNAAAMTPSLEQGQYAGIPAYLAAAQTGAEIPYTGERIRAQGIGGLLGQYTKTKSNPGLGGLLGGALSLGARAFGGMG